MRGNGVGPAACSGYSYNRSFHLKIYECDHPSLAGAGNFSVVDSEGLDASGIVRCFPIHEEVLKVILFSTRKINIYLTFMGNLESFSLWIPKGWLLYENTEILSKYEEITDSRQLSFRTYILRSKFQI